MKEKIRLAYLSSDFASTSAAGTIFQLLRNHDRTKFEITALSNVANEDRFTSIVKQLVDNYINVSDLSILELSEQLKKNNYDVIVDLNGHTDRNSLLSLKDHPAKVICSTLGFGYTTGLNFIDFYVGDELFLPETSQQFFAEKLMAIDAAFPAAVPANKGDTRPLPALTNGYVTFGSLSRSVRLNENVLSAWAEVLKSVKNSRLIINSINFQHRTEQERLLSEFLLMGIEPNRIDVYFETPPWQTFDKIDIALDCFPHNSGTTLIEGLAKGIPYITLVGEISIQRLGYSYLKRLKLNEYIAHSVSDYIHKAKSCAENISDLVLVRRFLSAQFEIFLNEESKKFTKSFEEKLIIALNLY